MSYRAIAFALGMLLTTFGPAHADSVVTLCQSDRQAGSGTNLATAVSSGGLVVFNCGGTANISVSTSLSFSRNVVIDGGGTVTLVEGSEPMFVASANASIELKNLKFRDTKSGIVRGGPKGSPPVTITGTTFTNCAPVVGLSVGAIVIRDSVFTNCTGHVVTGSERLTVERSRFEGTKVTNGEPGVAVFAVGSELRIVDSIFTSNQGGAVMVGVGSAGDDNHKVEIVRSTFDNNGTDDPAGLTNRIGAISLSCSDRASNCTIKVSNSKFSKNRAENGAAMLVSGAAEVSLRGARFEGNVAKKEGGAIHYTQRSDRAPANPRLEMLHTVFTDNSADIGGAVRVSDAGITARAVAFSKNRAANLGSAIASSQARTVQIDRGVFVDNSADSQGAVSLFRNRQATISNTIIARNTSRNGGGVFAAAAARFINATIVDNVGIGIQRPWQGVGVSGSIRFRNTIIANNSAGNCRVFAAWRSVRFIDDGTNLQFPDTSCGASIPVANPHLDKLYLPVFGSPPWSRGHNPTCLAEPVAARDVYNKVRPLAIACSIGAAEGDLEKEVADRTVGGANWPDGLNNKSGYPKIPPTSLPSPQQTPDSSRCCCLFACRR